MKTISKQLKFFLNVATIYARIARSFDTGLVGGIGFNDFVILYHLSLAPEQKMRRIDLAEKVSLTASGVTRMLLPMEKIGLVKREESIHDKRVSYVKLASGGKRILEEAMERAEMKCEEFLPSTDIKKLKDISEIISLFTFNTLR
ncbi:MAG: MarR family transcriptional regulator [Patescibacteria group bacterium]|jgi:DNA-binding MarR family transcriptional regulator